jgi:signal transduction histidine kinase
MLELVQTLWDQMRLDLKADMLPQVNDACQSLLSRSLGPLDELQLEDLQAIERSLEKLSRRLEGQPIDWADHSESTHALRGPLNSTIGFSRLLLRGVDGPITDDQRQALETIYNNSRRMLVLFNLLLDTSTLGLEGVRITCEEADLHTLLNELILAGQKLAESKDVAFEVKIADFAPDTKLYSDQSRFKQALIGLLALLVRYAEQASLSLSVEPATGEQQVRIDMACAQCAFPPSVVDAYPKLLTDEADLSVPYDVHLRLGLTRELLAQLGGRLEVSMGENSLTQFVILHPVILE